MSSATKASVEEKYWAKQDTLLTAAAARTHELAAELKVNQPQIESPEVLGTLDAMLFCQWPFWPCEIQRVGRKSWTKAYIYPRALPFAAKPNELAAVKREMLGIDEIGAIRHTENLIPAHLVSAILTCARYVESESLNVARMYREDGNARDVAFHTDLPFLDHAENLREIKWDRIVSVESVDPDSYERDGELVTLHEPEQLVFIRL